MSAHLFKGLGIGSQMTPCDAGDEGAPTASPYWAQGFISLPVPVNLVEKNLVPGSNWHFLDY